ncbi:hypothetical protein [Rhodomicrobium sp.]|uniref:hypothetical protein n=1 Tax=Rhodomicrobium sp. TaxID=2720632 RepID=UPI0039E6EF96
MKTGFYARRNEPWRRFASDRGKAETEAREAKEIRKRARFHASGAFARVRAKKDARRARQPLADKRLLALGLTSSSLTRADVIAAFRTASKRAHPDAGGSDAAARTDSSSQLRSFMCAVS